VLKQQLVGGWCVVVTLTEKAALVAFEGTMERLAQMPLHGSRRLLLICCTRQTRVHTYVATTGNLVSDCFPAVQLDSICH
jgi:hypothetical protein